MKALVVSDSTTMRRILENALRAAGIDEVVVHSDGRVAAESIDGSVAAIVTDWGLPGMSGIDLVRALRSREDGADVQVLMVTSRNAHTDVECAIAAGVNGYLLKPFTADALRVRIDQLLQPFVVSGEDSETSHEGSDSGSEEDRHAA